MKCTTASLLLLQVLVAAWLCQALVHALPVAVSVQKHNDTSRLDRQRRSPAFSADIELKRAKMRAMSALKTDSHTPDVELAMRASWLSAAAYCPQTYIQRWTCKPCYETNIVLTGIQRFSKYVEAASDTHAYLGVDHINEQIVVVFQGTKDTTQEWEDMDAAKVTPEFKSQPPDVLVHQGFLLGYESIRKELMNAITKKTKKYPTYEVLVTGHSLGGALATLCTVDIATLLQSVTVHMYTFGQPRVGNFDFVEFFKRLNIASSCRFVHYTDMVPHLPPELDYYYHVPTEVYYENYYGPSSLHVCDGSGEDTACSDQFWFSHSLANHLNYLGHDIASASCASVSSRSTSVAPFTSTTFTTPGTTTTTTNNFPTGSWTTTTMPRTTSTAPWTTTTTTGVTTTWTTSNSGGGSGMATVSRCSRYGAPFTVSDGMPDYPQAHSVLFDNKYGDMRSFMYMTWNNSNCAGDPIYESQLDLTSNKGVEATSEVLHYDNAVFRFKKGGDKVVQRLNKFCGCNLDSNTPTWKTGQWITVTPGMCKQQQPPKRAPWLCFLLGGAVIDLHYQYFPNAYQRSLLNNTVVATTPPELDSPIMHTIPFGRYPDADECGYQRWAGCSSQITTTIDQCAKRYGEENEAFRVMCLLNGLYNAPSPFTMRACCPCLGKYGQEYAPWATLPCDLS
ncbi:hypothetical protein PTSG_05361 [Salpingoeca rosetta]|uniref:Fungal lipase-type domain-containing protein n=1 Tax=Salpingoeca rosetta (strain ATCC 50818 / BSB-021) TaxID=946362 RepID=F2UA76_SALR5|nr:uncharacterized protein PTSG_05361 [Salpingoeca rosetta]EGD73651.1 hypothetical protein PTSG_05361 [Salpingoeca rosetta]|eukprot:XP_004993932.1 hypothetical protein PTSG_05361 [Salpingoeca rosetta]